MIQSCLGTVERIGVLQNPSLLIYWNTLRHFDLWDINQSLNIILMYLAPSISFNQFSILIYRIILHKFLFNKVAEFLDFLKIINFQLLYLYRGLILRFR